MGISFGDLVNRVMDTVNDHTVEMEQYVRHMVSRNYIQVAQDNRWDELLGYLTGGITFTANQAYLVLPGDAANILHVSNATNAWPLRQVSLERIVSGQISDIDTSGEVVYYSILGHKPMLAPLSADTTVSVLTEKAADTSLNIRVCGLRADPEITECEVIATHASDPVNTKVDGTLTFREGWSLSSVFLDGESTGHIYFHETADATKIVARISKDDFSSTYLILQLENPPATADSLKIVYKKRVRPLLNDSDIMEIPAEEIVIEQTIAQVRRRDEQYMQAREHDGVARNLAEAIFNERGPQSNMVRQARPSGRYRYRGY